MSDNNDNKISPVVKAEGRKKAQPKIIDYDVGEMEKAIEKCYANIKVFEKAIQDEHATIKRYRDIVINLEGRKEK